MARSRNKKEKLEQAESSKYPCYPQIELATAYIPPQELTTTFSPSEALNKGTLFPELYRPYLGCLR